MPETCTPSDTLTLEATNGRFAGALYRIAVTSREHAAEPAAPRAALLDDLHKVTLLAVTALAETVTDTTREYGVLSPPDADDNTIRSSEVNIGHLSRALRAGSNKVGQYGITRFTVRSRVHVGFPDGSSWTSAWEPVDYRGTLFDCPHCGRTVFRAGSLQSGQPFLVDADPAPAGDLVLIPSEDHGGEPGAVYGEQPRPGMPRYRRHPGYCTSGGRR